MARARPRRARGRYTFDYSGDFSLRFGQAFAWPSAKPRWKLRDDNDVAVRLRSPNPARPKMFRCAHHRLPQPSVSAKPRSSGGTGILSRLAPGNDSAGDRNDVLDRPAQLNPDRVARDIGSKAGTAQCPRHALRQRGLMGRDGNRSRQACGDLGAKLARQDRNLVPRQGSLRTSLKSRSLDGDAFGADDQRH